MSKMILAFLMGATLITSGCASVHDWMAGEEDSVPSGYSTTHTNAAPMDVITPADIQSADMIAPEPLSAPLDYATAMSGDPSVTVYPLTGPVPDPYTRKQLQPLSQKVIGEGYPVLDPSVIVFPPRTPERFPAAVPLAGGVRVDANASIAQARTIQSDMSAMAAPQMDVVIERLAPQQQNIVVYQAPVIPTPAPLTTGARSGVIDTSYGTTPRAVTLTGY